MEIKKWRTEASNKIKALNFVRDFLKYFKKYDLKKNNKSVEIRPNRTLIAIQIIPSKEHLIVHLFETKEENIAYCILEIIYESHLDDSIVKIIEKNKIWEEVSSI